MNSFLEATEDGIMLAASILDRGKLLAFPTETVYGLGADAENPLAIAQLYATKGRPVNHPVIVHISTQGDPGYWISGPLPNNARVLIDAFWPGPLTLILRRAEFVPAAVSGGQPSIGLRCPSHSVAQALLSAFHNIRHANSGKQGGIAAPSANRFGHVSPTTAQHVLDEFGDAVPILDGNPCELGIESTILDLSRGQPVLLRPGSVSAMQLADVLGEMPQLPAASDSTTPRASGRLKAHYAPYIPLWLLNANEISEAIHRLHSHLPGQRIALIVHRGAVDQYQWTNARYLSAVIAPQGPDAYAHDLYHLLRKLENAKNVSHILVEKPPDTLAWAAVNDRLKRAAAAFNVIKRD